MGSERLTTLSTTQHNFLLLKYFILKSQAVHKERIILFVTVSFNLLLSIFMILLIKKNWKYIAFYFWKVRHT